MPFKMYVEYKWTFWSFSEGLMEEGWWGRRGGWVCWVWENIEMFIFWCLNIKLYYWENRMGDKDKKEVI